MRSIYLVGGGTAGHINAALSVGDVFAQDFKVRYITGQRNLDKSLYPQEQTISISSQPLRTKNPLRLGLNLLKNIQAFCRLIMVYIWDRPIAIVGAGGYVCGPALMAGKVLGVPIYIIEQNAVMGMTNKILSQFANIVFTNFATTQGLPKKSLVRVVGNPIRKEIQYSPAPHSDVLQILVFGGSLGANQINQITLGLLEKKFPFDIKIVHQVGKGNLHSIYDEKSFYLQKEYIHDMQQAYCECQVIISRAGASTVAELQTVKRPCILIPFPHATDNHQYFNAKNLKEEADFKVEILDPHKSVEELVDEVYDSLKEIYVVRNQQAKVSNPGDSSALKIKKEILKNVRN